MAGKKQPKLTEGQKECLRLVDQLLTSKEIARRLNISPFTVDQRLDAARRKLNAANRKDAARIFAEQDKKPVSERFVYEAQPVETPSNSAKLSGPSEQEGGSSGDSRSGAGEWVIFPGLGNEGNFLRFTLPVLGGEQHNYSKLEVASAIMKTALFSILSISALTIIIVGLMKVLG
ncbi:response regulator transcription factor [Sphingorhabdus arenilitoris]|uniref:Response regulator transcription factor n=1 Tax=Sphingorhabdus arenilitoris TaxID=1490041 RepID=A0ABV8RD08_9SPHN